MPGVYQMHQGGGTDEEGCLGLTVKIILLIVVLIIFATFAGVRV